MSKENDDEARFYRSFRKYEKMVQQMRQFDELAAITDAVRYRSSKKKRCCCCDNQENLNQLLVETITKFLNEMKEEDKGTGIDDPKPSNNQ
ncbi:hypothetical protein WN944_027852 [Citrus x changshan-huyou]|uniref:Uncharacterized protein n=1 Tax=Citrus x changshan-huyou TaxID=2935761 RepID=A0AAP0LKS0_9ROSI